MLVGAWRQPHKLLEEPRESQGDRRGCHSPPQKTTHPGNERHWLTYLAELGPSVLRHRYGEQVGSRLTELFAWQKTRQNESSICIHTCKSTATELGVSRRDLTEGRSLPASELAPESRDALCQQSDFRRCFRLIVKSKPAKTP